MSAAIEAHGVGKRYGSLLALEDLTFSVQPGEIMGVLGPNGAGKTTAIRILTTVLEPTHGSFSVAGIGHHRPAEIRRRIGVLPESAGYPERQTAEEYLRYHARLHGHSASSARAVTDALLEEVGLSARKRSLIVSYSRGMRQRLGIARTLVNDPEVVFLDEPTLGLDPAGQRHILGNVRRIATERGATVLLCTHLLDEVEENCSRVLILSKGHVIAEGTVAEVARKASAPRSGRLLVPHEQAEQALAVLAGTGGVEEVEPAGDEPGSLKIVFAASANGAAPSGTPNDAVRALLDSGVELLSFELERPRLSDAFLAITEAHS
jgi:ABC-2 type transport system ATP-binding protein